MRLLVLIAEILPSSLDAGENAELDVLLVYIRGRVESIIMKFVLNLHKELYKFREPTMIIECIQEEQAMIGVQEPAMMINHSLEELLQE